MLRAYLFATLLTVVVWPSLGQAQVVYPEAPEKYEVQLRYRIRADRDERIRQYRALKMHLKAISFEETIREDGDLDIFDPTAEMLSGSISSANLTKLFDDPRIITVVARPTTLNLPEDGKKPVAVRMRLSAGLARNEERALHEQTVRHLGFLGFQESLGYDHQNFTRMRGSMPAENVLKLTKDLRTLPAGWFAPAVPSDQQPAPFRSTLPIRFVEILPDPEMIAEAAPIPGDMPKMTSPKFTTDAKNYVEDPANAGKPARVDLILEQEPGLDWQNFRERVRNTVEGCSVEGLVGLVLSVRVNKTEDLAKLAEIVEVKAIRLPRHAAETGSVVATAAKSNGEAISESRVAQLHKLGFQGGNAKVVLIASDFSGLLGALGTDLPKNTKLVDLTAELNPELLPTPGGEKTGSGLLAAKIIHATAPKATLTLVRIDPTAFHQLLSLAKSITGESAYSEALQSRAFELNRQAENLTAKRSSVVEEYRKAFSDLSDDDKPAARRAAATKAVEGLLAEEQKFKAVVDRFTRLKEGVDGLKGTTLVVNTLTFDTGFPQDGLNELSRTIDAKFTAPPVRSSIQSAKLPPVPVWVQAAGIRPAQIWAGPFLDDEGDGILEFAPATTALPKGRWTRELNFLDFQPNEGMATTNLPVGLKVRFTIQWREPQDPDGYVPREPVLPLTMRLLRQIDPTGKTAASDELVEVAKSTGNPVKLLRTNASGAFEQTLEVTIPKDGVYALRIEGRSAFEYQIPALRQKVEVAPRIVVESLDATKGTPVFRTFTSARGGVGTPGDAGIVVTVGTTTGSTQMGAGPGVFLSTKPDLVSYPAITINSETLTGSMAATAFIGGSIASLSSAGVRGNDLIRNLGLKAGENFILPNEWLKSLNRRPAE
jgi:hypothetical protein